MNTGIKLLEGDGNTDLEEASALSHERDTIDIYSNSWGPADTGSSVMGPRTLTRLALEKGINKVSKLCCAIHFCASYNNVCRDVEERGAYMYGPVVMEEIKMTVVLMVLCPVFLPSLLGLLELTVTIVILMKDAPQKWLQHM